MIGRFAIMPLLAFFMFLVLGCGDTNPHNNALTLKAVCGVDSSQEQTAKIVGGKDCGSSNGSVVKILLFDEEENQTVCTGVRLNSSSVLTAAHCLNEFVFSVLVELGSGERIAPTAIVLHPEAADLGSLFVNDLAILTISPPKEELAPPRIPIAKRIAIGDSLTILGYGVNSAASPGSAGVLRVGEMRVDQVTEDSIFSDYKSLSGSNTCFGDSGGPAFIEDESGALALVGITSTGINVRCALGDRSAFTNLTNQALREFVESEM